MFMSQIEGLDEEIEIICVQKIASVFGELCLHRTLRCLSAIADKRHLAQASRARNVDVAVAALRSLSGGGKALW
jgi:hypothetical protein